MNHRGNLISGIVLCTIASVILLIAYRNGLNAVPVSVEHQEIETNLEYPEAPPQENLDYGDLAVRNLFSRDRDPQVRQQKIAEEEARIKAEEEAKRKAEEEAKRKAEEEAKRKAEEEANRITPLKEYPDAWPRLKLTGIYVVNGEKGVAINGGKTLTVSAGNLYSTLFHVGDDVGGGVTLLEIQESSVVLVKDKQSWPIRLGAEPPAVKKK